MNDVYLIPNYDQVTCNAENNASLLLFCTVLSGPLI